MNTPETAPPDAVIDLKGLRCPGPLLGAKRLLDELAEGETLLLISDCPGTRDDLFAWARVTGNQVTASGRRADGGHGYLIRKGRAERPPAQAVLAHHLVRVHHAPGRRGDGAGEGSGHARGMVRERAGVSCRFR